MYSLFMLIRIAVFIIFIFFLAPRIMFLWQTNEVYQSVVTFVAAIITFIYAFKALGLSSSFSQIRALGRSRRGR